MSVTSPWLSEVLHIHSSTRRILIKMAIGELERRVAEWRRQDRNEQQRESVENRRSKRMGYIAQRSIYNACADAKRQEGRGEPESEAEALTQSLLLVPSDSMQHQAREREQASTTLSSGCILQEIKSKLEKMEMELSDDPEREIGDHKSAHRLRHEGVYDGPFPNSATLDYDDDVQVKALPIKLDSLQRPLSRSRVSFAIPSRTKAKAADPYNEVDRIEIRPSLVSIESNQGHEQQQEMRESGDGTRPVHMEQSRGSNREDTSGGQGSIVEDSQGVEMENSCESAHFDDEMRSLETTERSKESPSAATPALAATSLALLKSPRRASPSRPSQAALASERAAELQPQSLRSHPKPQQRPARKDEQLKPAWLLKNKRADRVRKSSDSSDILDKSTATLTSTPSGSSIAARRAAPDSEGPVKRGSRTTKMASAGTRMPKDELNDKYIDGKAKLLKRTDSIDRIEILVRGMRVRAGMHSRRYRQLKREMQELESMLHTLDERELYLRRGIQSQMKTTKAMLMDVLHDSSSLCSDTIIIEDDAGPAFSPHHSCTASDSHPSRQERRQPTSALPPQHGRHRACEQDESVGLAMRLEQVAGDDNEDGSSGGECALREKLNPLPADSEYQQISALGPDDARGNQASAVFMSSGRPIQLSSSSQPPSPHPPSSRPPLTSHRSLPCSISLDLDTGLKLNAGARRAAQHPSRVVKDSLRSSPGPRRRAREYSPRSVNSYTRTRVRYPQPDWSYVQPVVDCHLNRSKSSTDFYSSISPRLIKSPRNSRPPWR